MAESMPARRILTGSELAELLRPEWLGRLLEVCDRLAWTPASPDERARVVDAELARIDPPRTIVEDAVLCGLRVRLCDAAGGPAAADAIAPPGPEGTAPATTSRRARQVGRLPAHADPARAALPSAMPLTGTGRSHGALVRRALSFIHDSCERHLTTAIVARACGCSTRKLEREFRHETRWTVHAYLTHVRLVRLTRLLENPDVKIAALAQDLGFRAKSSLYRAVRRLTGTTPARLRRGVR